MPRYGLILLCLMFFHQLTAQPANTDGWIFKSEKEGVKVYYRKTADVYELKLTTSIETSIHGLIMLFAEAYKYDNWAYKVIESKLLKKNSETDFYYYVRIDFPWPISDRDLVMHSSLYQNRDRMIVSSSVAEPKYLPEVEGVVRIQQSKTRWNIYPGRDGWLYVEYYLYSDPGGNIPDWAVNMALESGPLQTFKNIRKILKDPRYQTARLAYIKD